MVWGSISYDDVGTLGFVDGTQQLRHTWRYYMSCFRKTFCQQTLYFKTTIYPYIEQELFENTIKTTIFPLLPNPHQNYQNISWTLIVHFKTWPKNTRDDLFTAILDIWHNKKLYLSIPRRIQAVLRSEVQVSFAYFLICSVWVLLQFNKNWWNSSKKGIFPQLPDDTIFNWEKY